MRQQKTGLFITFEGPEGSGKSTQIRLLAGALEALGYSVLATREPGGTAIGNRIRSVVLDEAHTEMSPRTEALLYSAARAQIVDEVISPALADGQLVLCDRYVDSTIAYQGYGHERPIDELRILGLYATDGLTPDMTIYLEIEPAEGLARKQFGDSEEWNRFEQQALDYHHRVHNGYLRMVEEEPERWRVVNANQDEETIHNLILRQVKALLKTS